MRGMSCGQYVSIGLRSMPGMRSSEFQNVSGQIACKFCPVGFIAKAKSATRCQKCNIGEGTDNLTGSISCTTCEGGTYGLLEAGVINAAGRFRESGDKNYTDSCRECPRGFFNSEDGQAACFCAPGEFQENPGQRNCSQCQAGKFQGKRAAGVDLSRLVYF